MQLLILSMQLNSIERYSKLREREILISFSLTNYLQNNIIILLLLFSVFSSCKKSEKEKVIAIVNDEYIFSSEVDKLIVQELYDELNRIYNIKKVALDAIVENRVLKQESLKYNLDCEDYLNQYIKNKIDSYTYENLIAQYGIDENVLYHQRLSLKEVSPSSYEGRMLQLVFLRKAIRKQLVDSLVQQSHTQRYLYPPTNPKLNLIPYVVAYQGNLASKVTMILISDFECGKCYEYHSVYDSIYTKYKDKIRFGYVNFSDSPSATILASEAVNNQNKFWDYYNCIFAEKGYIDSTKIFHIANELSIDMKKFEFDFNSTIIYDQLVFQFKKIQEIGIYATPTVVINGKLLFNSGSYEEIAALIDIELKR